MYMDYPDIVMICYAINNPWSLDRVKTKWTLEVNYHRPDLPFMLVGLKMELRNAPETVSRSNKQPPPTLEDLERMAREVGAVGYIETSAATGQGVFEAFEMAATAVLNGERKRRPRKSASSNRQCSVS